MSEEYIKASKGCVYVIGGKGSTNLLFDFHGEYFVEGGFEEKSLGIIAHVRSVAAVILSAPSKSNLGTASAILEKNPLAPVIANTPQLKTVKPESSGADWKRIQEQLSANLLSLKQPIFDGKYQPFVIYQSLYKGTLSLYILAGDAKDGELIAKALSSGNEDDVTKAVSQHGTVAVLLWRPAEAHKPVTRVLISGTCSINRIHQALEKAHKFLPFLHSADVKSKDAFVAVKEQPTSNRNGATAAATKPVVGASLKMKSSAVGAAPVKSATRPARPSATVGGVTAPTSRTGPTRPATTRPIGSTGSGTKPAATSSNRPRPPTATSVSTSGSRKPAGPISSLSRSSGNKAGEAPIQKKTIGKVQGSNLSKPTPPAGKIPATNNEKPVSPSAIGKNAPEAQKKSDKEISSPKSSPSKGSDEVVQQIPNVVIENGDDSIVCLGDFPPNDENASSLDIVVIPPTPEPVKDEKSAVESDVEDPNVNKNSSLPSTTEVNDSVEPEIPSPIDAFKDDPKPEPVVPSAPVIEEDVIVVPTPPAPAPPQPLIPADVIDPKLDDNVDVAQGFVPFTPSEPNGGLIQIDEKVASGFEEPLIPQAIQSDGTLADCGEDPPELKKISMDTDKDGSAPPSDVSQLAKEFGQLDVKEKTINGDADDLFQQQVRKSSAQLFGEAPLPVASAIASFIVGESDPNEAPAAAASAVNDLIDINDDTPKTPQAQPNTNGSSVEEQKDVAKHELMQSRSGVLENGTKLIEYEKADPVLDEVLDACAHESEKLDGEEIVKSYEKLGMVHKPAVIEKGPKFTKKFWFDVVTAPRNEKLQTNLDENQLREFVANVRAKHLILPSIDITTSQLEGILAGKSCWAGKPCSLIPTHSSPILSDFKHRNEEQLVESKLSIEVAIEKCLTQVSSDSGANEYALSRIVLRED